jgi:hypothetical protein
MLQRIKEFRAILRLVVVVTLLAACTGANAAAHKKAAVDPNVRFISQAYAYMDYGWSTTDVNRLTKYMTPDCAYVLPNGTAVTRRDIMYSVYHAFKKFREPSVRRDWTLYGQSQITNLTWVGSSIVAHRIVTFTVNAGQGDVASGALDYIDTWIRQGRGWYIEREQLTNTRLL